MLSKDPIDCAAVALFHCLTGNQRRKPYFYGETYHFSKIPCFFFFVQLYDTKKHINRNIFINSDGCTGFIMICILTIFIIGRTMETLKAPLLYQHEKFYHEVSLQASHYSFVIVNDRD